MAGASPLQLGLQRAEGSRSSSPRCSPKDWVSLEPNRNTLGVGVPAVPAARGRMAGWPGCLPQGTALQESPKRDCRALRSSTGLRQQERSQFCEQSRAEWDSPPWSWEVTWNSGWNVPGAGAEPGSHPVLPSACLAAVGFCLG